MATGQRPNEGRFTRRRSPANVTANRPTQRLNPLVQTSASATDYGSQAQNANKIARDYFWGATVSSVTGTIAETEAADTSTASGSVRVTGTIVETEALDTSTASGAVRVTGTIAETESADTSTASGTVTSAGVTGTIAETEAVDTSTAAGTITVTGSIGETESPDTSTASGTVTVTGTIAETEALDTSAAAGDVSGGPLTGTIAATESSDTSTASGTVSGGVAPAPNVGGTASTWQSLSALAAGNRPRLVATAAAAEADDVCDAQGVLSINFDAELEQLLLVGAI